MLLVNKNIYIFHDCVENILNNGLTQEPCLNNYLLIEKKIITMNQVILKKPTWFSCLFALFECYCNVRK